MDPKKKKIYIGIIVGCMIIIAGSLGYNQYITHPHVSNTLPSSAGNTSATTPVDASGSILTGFTAPTVFPATNTFHTEVLDSKLFKQLQVYQAVDATGQLGKPDLFKSY